MTSRRRFLGLGAGALGLAAAGPLAWGGDTLPADKATPFSAEGRFSRAMEGPATAPDGAIFVANFKERGTIGRVSPEGDAQLFLTLPEGAVANGARFDAQGALFLADYKGHRILKVDLASRGVTVHCHEPRMHQPNDLAIGPGGALYASDPDWKGGGGKLWRIDASGVATCLLSAGLVTPNGLDLTPGGDALIVSETKSRRVRRFALKGETLTPEGAPLITFKDGELDGLRVDPEGRIHVTRPRKGEVVILSPKGEILRRVRTTGDIPTNLTFGGPGGRTAYVCVADKGRLETYTF